MSGDSRWVALTPRDTVLVRDGRSFDAGTDTTAEAVLPWPSTIAGALTAAYQGREPVAVRGPVLARRTGSRWAAMFPVPLDLVAVPGEHRVSRLRPESWAGVTTDLPTAPAVWLVGDGDPLEGWMTASALETYLAGALVPAGGSVLEEALDLERTPPLLAEPRIGLARADRVARTGMLYQAAHLRPVDGVALLAEVDVETSMPVVRGPVALGGQGRLADVHEVDAQGGPQWPDPPSRFPGGFVVLYVATPALWPDGWRPPLPDSATLYAAAVGAPQPVAMASPRLGTTTSRILRWAVPPGSVYVLRFADEASAGRWAGPVHGKALGPRGGTPEKGSAYTSGGYARLRTAGFGTVLTGAWS